MFELGRAVTREYIASVLGGSAEPYLPQDQTGRVVAACVRFDLNPDAPEVILPGTGPVIEASAKEFCKGYAVPTFVKLAVGEWMFVGRYRVVRRTTDLEVVEQHQAKAELLGRGRKGSERITMVLYLEPAGDYYDLRIEGVRKP